MIAVGGLAAACEGIMTLDPVTLAVIQNGLRQVASEMDLVHEKTSFSPVISEGVRPLERHLPSA